MFHLSIETTHRRSQTEAVKSARGGSTDGKGYKLSRGGVNREERYSVLWKWIINTLPLHPIEQPAKNKLINHWTPEYTHSIPQGNVIFNTWQQCRAHGYFVFPSVIPRVPCVFGERCNYSQNQRSLQLLVSQAYLAAMVTRHPINHRNEQVYTPGALVLLENFSKNSGIDLPYFELSHIEGRRDTPVFRIVTLKPTHKQK